VSPLLDYSRGDVLVGLTRAAWVCECARTCIACVYMFERRQHAFACACDRVCVSVLMCICVCFCMCVLCVCESVCIRV